MSKKKEIYVSEWKPLSELRTVQEDISDLGYKKEYINEHRLRRTKKLRWMSGNGEACFDEPIEVKKKGNDILWRVNESIPTGDNGPKEFNTQYGVFINHNNGEFESWLGKEDYRGSSEETDFMRKEIGLSDYLVEGNYCDMFDLGDHCYAISNLMHMGSGIFKMIKINQNLEIETMYDNESDWDECLRYMGRFQKDGNQMIIASGSRESLEDEDNERENHGITLLFCVDKYGNCSIEKEWDITISESNSLAVFGDHVYFGQNKMITRFSLTSGEVEYYTDKSDEELAALVKGW